jgi:hypothetical protein
MAASPVSHDKSELEHQLDQMDHSGHPTGLGMKLHTDSDSDDEIHGMLLLPTLCLLLSLLIIPYQYLFNDDIMMEPMNRPR